MGRQCNWFFSLDKAEFVKTPPKTLDNHPRIPYTKQVKSKEGEEYAVPGR